MFSPVNEWLTIAFASPHKITIMLKIFIYNPLLWLAEYQCKGVVKFNLSDLVFRGLFRRSWKRLNWKTLLLTLIAVTRIINLAYLWRRLIFRWTLYKADTLSCTNGQRCPLYRDSTVALKRHVEFNQRY